MKVGAPKNWCGESLSCCLEGVCFLQTNLLTRWTTDNHYVDVSYFPPLEQVSIVGLSHRQATQFANQTIPLGALARANAV